MRKLFRNSDNLYTKIPEPIKGIFEFLANVFAVLTVVGGFAYSGIKIIFGIKNPSTSGIDLTRVILIAMVAVLVMLLIRLKNIKANSLKKDQYMTQRDQCISQEYYRFLHDYRNVINQMECDYKRQNLNLKLLTDTVEHFLENTLDYLTEILSTITAEKVCGCVKVIVGEGFEKISYEEAKVKTFVRSRNSQEERKSFDVRCSSGVKISDNTDFMNIVSEKRRGNDSSFYQGDLKEYAESLKKIGQKYQNSTDNWEDYYLGTIVVPIRIANKRLFYTSEEESYNILGFLCVDSLSTKAFTEEAKQRNIYLVKSYAALVYNILSKYQFYLKQLGTTSVSVVQNNVQQRNNNTYNNGKNRRRKKNRQ